MIWDGLHYHGLYGHLEVVRLLIESNRISLDKLDSLGRTPLYHAATHGKDKIVEYLLENGADGNISRPNKLSPYYQANKNGHHRVVAILTEHGHDKLKSPPQLQKSIPLLDS